VTPLGAVALGLVLVLADLRASSVDLIPDPLGWLLVAVGTSRLAPLSARFGWASRCAVVAGVLSFADLVHPVVTRVDGLGSTTTSAVAPAGLQGLLVAASAVAGLTAAVLLSLAVRDRALEHGELQLAARFHLFARLHVVVGVLLLAGMLLSLAGASGSDLGPLLVLLVIAALAIEVWFIASLASARFRPWLLRAAAAADPAEL
jgi:hypothetical protein